MRPRNLQGWSAFEGWLQAQFNRLDWQWILAVIITAVTILLMLSNAVHIL
jgi:hypothetical protein